MTRYLSVFWLVLLALAIYAGGCDEAGLARHRRAEWKALGGWK